MSKQPPHSFHLRLPEDVLSFLMDEKGSNSLNGEIIDRLRGTMAQRDADRLGAALRPILDPLDDADREELVALTIRALQILAKGRTRPRRK
ncbi:MAG TPA: hypothetical protein VNS34_10520 [Rhizobiaceae bacterium]|nr:hypothetical protein [Rhizobiaceae bacterium]